MQFNDAIHGIIEVNGQYEELIQVQAFQRLRGIRQQGNTYRLHPSAKHDRFSHSLGVFANVGKIMSYLQDTMQYQFTNHERKVALCSALLHDIGHGPFSHCFEQITGTHHEEWSIRIINEDLEIRRVLDCEHELSVDVTSVMTRQGKFPVIEMMLFSPIGADKLDYHNRDLVHSNLNIPPIDLELLISGLSIRNGMFVVAEDRLSEIEKMIRIRRNLFEQVFAHPIVVGYDLLLKMVFDRARLLRQKGELAYVPAELCGLLDEGTDWTVKDYEVLNDSFITQTVEGWIGEADRYISDLASRYVNDDDSITPFNWLYIRNEALLRKFEACSDPCNAMIYVSDVKYGSYRGGIYLETTRGIIDAKDASIEIRSTISTPEKFFYYICETSDIQRVLRSAG